MKQFSNTPLETAIKAIYCKNMGVEPHVVSGSRTVNTADSRNHLQTHCILGLQGRCKPGVTYYTFPPLQALFISGVETGEGRKSNDLIVRRSSMKDKCVQLPPCADSGAIRHRLLQLGGLLSLLEQELKAPADQKELEKIVGVGWVSEFANLVVELHRGDALLGGLCPNADYCMDSAVCYLQGNCLSQTERNAIAQASKSYSNDRRGGAR